jgi:acyl-CoA synthetase (AMP-forming)/AMP-acid ligase II
VPGHAGERVGAAVVRGSRALHTEQLRSCARDLLSAFKVPTVWMVLDSDDDVPRGGTGKVDIRRLREMLVDQSP